MTEKNNYYEIIYYTGETEYQAMSGDFLAETYEDKIEAKKRLVQLENQRNVYAIFYTVRDYETDEIVEG